MRCMVGARCNIETVVKVKQKINYAVLSLVSSSLSADGSPAMSAAPTVAATVDDANTASLAVFIADACPASAISTRNKHLSLIHI